MGLRKQVFQISLWLGKKGATPFSINFPNFYIFHLVKNKIVVKNTGFYHLDGSTTNHSKRRVCPSVCPSICPPLGIVVGRGCHHFFSFVSKLANSLSLQIWD